MPEMRGENVEKEDDIRGLPLPGSPIECYLYYIATGSERTPAYRDGSFLLQREQHH